MFKLILTLTAITLVSSSPYDYSTTKKPEAVIYIVPETPGPQNPYPPTIRPPYDPGFDTYDMRTDPPFIIAAQDSRPLSVPITTRRPHVVAPPGARSPDYGYVYTVCQPYCRRIYRRRYVMPICYPA